MFDAEHLQELQDLGAVEQMPDRGEVEAGLAAAFLGTAAVQQRIGLARQVRLAADRPLAKLDQLHGSIEPHPRRSEKRN